MVETLRYCSGEREQSGRYGMHGFEPVLSGVSWESCQLWEDEFLEYFAGSAQQRYGPVGLRIVGLLSGF